MIDTVEHKDTLLSNERKCIVTGEIRDRDEMYRFIIDPDNQILPDLAAKLPGRGFWVSANQSSLKLAIEKNLFDWRFSISQIKPSLIFKLFLADFSKSFSSIANFRDD